MRVGQTPGLNEDVIGMGIFLRDNQRHPEEKTDGHNGQTFPPRERGKMAHVGKFTLKAGHCSSTIQCRIAMQDVERPAWRLD